MKKIFKLLLMFLAFSPALAMAGPFDPPTTDISVKILNQIFGGLLQSGNDAFGGAITTFNSAVLALGGILAAYTILAGTLGTAHDGEMLGKKFSSVWIPIRYALGTALVLPVIPGGYCVMQQIVMWLVVQGVGLADMVWKSYLASPNMILTAKMSSATKADIHVFAKQVALAQACTQGSASIMNDGATGANGFTQVLVKPLGSFNYSVKINPNDPTQYMFGDQAGMLTMLTNTSCGSATIPVVPPANNAAAMVGATSTNANVGKLGDLTSAFRPTDTSPIYQAHSDAAKNLITVLGTTASAAVAAHTSIKIADVDKVADDYITKIETTGDAYAKSNEPFKSIRTASEVQGWMLAGAWYTKLTMLNKQISISMNSTPSADGTVVLGGISVGWLDSINPVVAKAQEEISLSLGERLGISNPFSEKNDANAKTTTSSSSSIFAKITAKLTTALIGIDMGSLQNDERPAILIIQEAGEKMLGMWATMMTVIAGGATAIGGAKIFGTGVDLNPAITTIMGFIMAPISGLVAIGFTLAYMLPNLPFLMWIGVVLGWIIMVIEAVIAAPLWAVMHLHPNGDDLTGKGANGYMLLLGLVLRPVLTIFGLIAALVVTDLMGEFVNKIFFSVFYIGTMSGWIAILGTIFAMGVYSMAMFSLFKKTFSLMHVIPDQLLRWIGGGGEQLGQYAGSIADGAGKGVGAATAAAGFIGEKAVSTVGRAAQENQQFKLRQAELERKPNEIANANDAISPGAGDTLAESRAAGYEANNETPPSVGTLGTAMTFGNNAKLAKDNLAEQNVTGALDKVSKYGPPGSDKEFMSKLGEAAKNGYQGYAGNSTAQKRIKAAHAIAGQILNKDGGGDNPPPPPGGGGSGSGGSGGGGSGGGGGDNTNPPNPPSGGENGRAQALVGGKQNNSSNSNGQPENQNKSIVEMLNPSQKPTAEDNNKSIIETNRDNKENKTVDAKNSALNPNNLINTGADNIAQRNQDDDDKKAELKNKENNHVVADFTNNIDEDINFR